MVDGQGLENRAAHPHEKFRRVPPGARRQLERSVSYQKQKRYNVWLILLHANVQFYA